MFCNLWLLETTVSHTVWELYSPDLGGRQQNAGGFFWPQCTVVRGGITDTVFEFGGIHRNSSEFLFLLCENEENGIFLTWNSWNSTKTFVT